MQVLDVSVGSKDHEACSWKKNPWRVITHKGFASGSEVPELQLTEGLENICSSISLCLTHFYSASQAFGLGHLGILE